MWSTFHPYKPLLALFGPTKATPALAANRLARWALMLGQYHYTIEYLKSAEHGNADALSRLPVGPDVTFDAEEGEADMDMVCTSKTISLQLNRLYAVYAHLRTLRIEFETWDTQICVQLDIMYLCLAHLTVGHFFTVFRACLALTWTVKKDTILNYGGCRVSLLTTVNQTGNV